MDLGCGAVAKMGPDTLLVDPKTEIAVKTERDTVDIAITRQDATVVVQFDPLSAQELGVHLMFGALNILRRREEEHHA